MNEAQRQSALQAMGIQSWFPRFIVPGAAPSPQCEASPQMFGLTETRVSHRSGLVERLLAAGSENRRSENKSSENPKSENKGTEDKSSEGKRNGDKSLTLATGQPAAVAPEPETGIAPKSGAQQPAPERGGGASRATQETLHVKLSFILLGGKIAVLNQLPTAGNGQMPASQQQLLTHIGRALGLRAEGKLFNAIHLFQWPMLNLPGMDNSLPAARSALLAFMEEHAQQQEVPALVILGRQLEELVLTGETVTGPLMNARTFSTYSLDQVMKMPSLKPELWRTLLPLRESA